MSWKINLRIERMPYHMLSADGPVATVKMELKQRCHTQRRDGQGGVTRVEFLRDSNVEFTFSLPLFVLSLPPQLCNLYILEKLLFSSNLDSELCVDLAPQIADFAVNNCTRGSLRSFLIKAEVEVDEEEEEDEMELLRITERLEEEEEDEMELLLRESLDLVRGISLEEEEEEDYEIELLRIREGLEEEEEMELLFRESSDLVRGISLEEEEDYEIELLRITERLEEEEEEEMELLLGESLDFVQKVDMGASISVIEKLKKERQVDSGGEVGTCMVCLEELSSVVELIKMPCEHLFHQSCICRWLEEKNSCPICRCEVA